MSKEYDLSIKTLLKAKYISYIKLRLVNIKNFNKILFTVPLYYFNLYTQ